MSVCTACAWLPAVCVTPDRQPRTVGTSYDLVPEITHHPLHLFLCVRGTSPSPAHPRGRVPELQLLKGGDGICGYNLKPPQGLSQALFPPTPHPRPSAPSLAFPRGAHIRSTKEGCFQSACPRRTDRPCKPPWGQAEVCSAPRLGTGHVHGLL